MESIIASWLPQQQFYRGSATAGDNAPHVRIVHSEAFMSGMYYIVEAEGELYQLFLNEHGEPLIDEVASWLEQSHGRRQPTTLNATLHGDIPKPFRITSAPDPEKRNLNFELRERDTGKKFFVRLFHHLRPGVSSEVELLSQLSGPHFPSIIGYVTTEIDGQSYTLSTIETFMEGALGSELATLYAQAGLFEHRQLINLGQTVRYMHDTLAMDFPSAQQPSTYMAEYVVGVLDNAIARHPDMEQFRPDIDRMIQQMPDEFPVQRIHGLMSLKHTLIYEDEWAIVDFADSVPHAMPALRSPTDDVTGIVASLRYYGAQNPNWCEAVVPIFLEGYGIDPGSPLFRVCMARRGIELFAAAENPEQRVQALRLMSLEV